MLVMSSELSRDERLDGLGHVRSLKQTALILGVSMSTLQRKIADGSLKVVKLSKRRVGITDGARAAFVRQNTE
jgi:predicted site-specific integrase-resolvase